MFLLAHLSQWLKRAFLTKICPLSVVVVVLVVVVNFHIFIFFSKTAGPISTKLGTKHPWVKGIQVCANEGPRPFPRGDNYKIVKIHWRNIKIFFFRTAGPISTRFAQSIPWRKGFKFVQMLINSILIIKSRLWVYRSPESLRGPIAMGWRPSSCVVRRPSSVNIFFSRTTGPILVG